MNNFRALNAKTTHAVISLFWSLLSRNGGWFRLFGPLIETWSSTVHPHILQITWKLWLETHSDTFRYIGTRFHWVKLNKTNKHEAERRKRFDLKILGSDLLHNTVHADITELLWAKYVYCMYIYIYIHTDKALLHNMRETTKLQNCLKELIPCCPTFLHHTLCTVLR